MSIELNKESVEQADASSCQGTNCGTTTGDHSSECLAEAAAGQGWELKPGDLCGRDCPIHKILAEQAGGDRWDALQSIMEWTAAENIPDERKLCLIRNAARAALAQPSPKCVKCGGTGEADSGGVHPWGEPVSIPCDCETEQAEPELEPHIPAQTIAEAAIEQLIKSGAKHYQEFHFDLHLDGHEGARPVVVTVAFSDGPSAHELRMKAEQERDAALARVAELEAKLAEMEKQVTVAWGAFHFGGERDGKLYTHCETEAQIDAYILDMHRSSDSLTLRKSPLYAAPVAQAQHSVPDGAADLCRFLAKLYCELDGLRYSTAKLPAEQIADALIFKWPVLQGARNQLNIKRISEQPYDESKLHSAIAAMLAAAPGKEEV
ncbi:hypothetical protein [Pseudomonas aeruginosa]|uniref:hypothetical protein n=1 Tax=Pseudomonas aeruginosa TaxID=287 RepID=UPI0029357D22|nr:hypothetical protein [Pseudomonas aeruginosa]MDV2663555.1 hypothetical protein [Pseudomonas aeruginosa]